MRKFGVITFPGSNCDQDMVFVLKNILNQDVVQLWHKSKNLMDVDVVILPGGFSYGDYLRSGAIASISPIIESVKEFADNGGLVIGICNGFQILCETGLLPGALLHNSNQKFICKNVFITPENNHSVVTKKISKKALKIPIAHGEGNYYISDEELKIMEDNQQIIFKYSDEFGRVNDESNPNGSKKNIAGISNVKGNVIGMMPHPERAADVLLNNTDGLELFQSIIN